MSAARADWRSRPQISRKDITRDLRVLGLSSWDTVLVHSSLSRLGHVVGGAEAVIDALLDAVGPDGTVLFPTLTGTELDGPGHPPYMDVLATPCWTGRIPETARRKPEAVRSLHPTHSIAAIGAEAARYASGHELSSTPCDQASPYYRLIQEDGLILLLGDVSEKSNTTLHCLEELTGVPYHLQDEVTEGIVIDADQVTHVVPNRLHLWGWEREFTKIDEPLTDAGALCVGRVGQGEARLMSARQLADTVLPLLERDPLYLLSDAARQRFVAGGRIRGSVLP